MAEANSKIGKTGQPDLKAIFQTKNTLKGIHLVKVTGGSFPQQKTTIVNGLWTIKSGENSSTAYVPRAALQSLDKITETMSEITFRASFKDGCSIVGESSKKTFATLYAEMTTGAQPGDVQSVVFIDTGASMVTKVIFGSLALLILFNIMDGGSASISPVHRETATTESSAAPDGEAVATVININGFLCARVTDVRKLEVQDQYEVTCREYRGGSGTARYIVNKSTGVAFKAN